MRYSKKHARYVQGLNGYRHTINISTLWTRLHHLYSYQPYKYRPYKYKQGKFHKTSMSSDSLFIINNLNLNSVNPIKLNVLKLLMLLSNITSKISFYIRTVLYKISSIIYKTIYIISSTLYKLKHAENNSFHNSCNRYFHSSSNRSFHNSGNISRKTNIIPRQKLNRRFCINTPSISNNSRNKPGVFKLLQLILGIVLIAFGSLSIINNTVVYTPLYFMRSLGGGISFGASSALLLLGIFLITYNRRKVLGIVVISIGLMVILFSVFMSLRMGLVQISLLKAILIFGSIVAGLALILRFMIKR